MSKYNIRDTVQLNKVKNLAFGDYIPLNTLKLGENYKITKREIEKYSSNCNYAYQILFTTLDGYEDTWWVGDCDIKPITRQLTFVFTE
jgi:hypothetical protein